MTPLRDASRRMVFVKVMLNTDITADFTFFPLVLLFVKTGIAQALKKVHKT
jgi:hypothetical protein